MRRINLIPRKIVRNRNESVKEGRKRAFVKEKEKFKELLLHIFATETRKGNIIVTQRLYSISVLFLLI